jgi:hypothetical protein
MDKPVMVAPPMVLAPRDSAAPMKGLRAMAINEKTGVAAILAIAASVAGILGTAHQFGVFFGIGIKRQNVSNFDTGPNLS